MTLACRYMLTSSVQPSMDGAKMESQGRVAGSISKTAQNQILPLITHSIDATSDNLVPAGSIHGDTTTDDSDEDLISGVVTDTARKNTVSISPNTISRSSSAGEARFRKSKGEDSTKNNLKSDSPENNSKEPKQFNLEKKNETMCSESDGIDDVPAPKSKPRLGKIGGKGNLIKSSDPNEHKTSTFEANSIPSRDRRKPTALDGEDQAYLSLPSDSDQLRKERASFPEKLPSPQRETSQERADHRREQLKRDLEATSITPIRKKRKF